MTVLRQTRTWKRNGGKTQSRIVLVNKLAPEQAQNVRLALRVLRSHFGTWPKLARALGMRLKSLERIVYGPRQPQAGHAMLAAALAKAPVDDLLNGKFSASSVCPTCGRVVGEL